MSTDPFRSAILPLRRLLGRTDAVIAVLLILTVLATLPDNRRMGSALQVVLPLMALGCAAARGKSVESLGRFVVLQVGLKGTKHLVGDSEISRRPDGGDRGFPSGHTAVATFGAVQMIEHCAPLHPATKGAALAAAAATGGSRIEADRHSLWQTIAGAVWGWAVAAAPWAGVRGIRRWIGRMRGRHV